MNMIFFILDSKPPLLLHFFVEGTIITILIFTITGKQWMMKSFVLLWYCKITHS